MRNEHPRRWRCGSDYAAVPHNDLDRTQRHVWRRRVVAEARAGNLPGKAVLTAEAMLACMGEDGMLYPSQAAIAAKAGIAVRSVTRHVERMVELGLVRKYRRLVRKPWPEGGRGASRVEQATNAYELLFPASHVVTKARMIRVRNTECQNGREESGRRFIPARPIEQGEAQMALQVIRTRREAVYAASWRARVPWCSEPSRTGAGHPPLRGAAHP